MMKTMEKPKAYVKTNRIPKIKDVVEEKETGEQNGNYWIETRSLPVGILCVDPTYQRHLVMPWAQYIADHYNPLLVETLQVSYRDGKYWVFNGQHTMTALKLKFNDNNLPVACKIYHGLTQKEEAKLFYEFNTCTRKIHSAAMLKAMAAYGDEEVTQFLKATIDSGFIIDPGKAVSCRYGIQAVTNALSCFADLGEEDYRRMLYLIHETWEGEQWAVSRNMLHAVSLIVKIYGDDLDDKRFIAKLQKVTQNQVKNYAMLFTEERVPVGYALALVKVYNDRLPKKYRLDKYLLMGE